MKRVRVGGLCVLQFIMFASHCPARGQVGEAGLRRERAGWAREAAEGAPANYLSLAGRPQAAPTPILYAEKTLKELKALQQAALKSGYALKQTAYLCNNIGPRLSGSPQAQRAVEYVAEEMGKLGLEVRLQKLSVPHWVRGEEKGALVEFPGMTPGTTQRMVLVTLAGSAATPPEGLTAEVVVVNNL